MPAPTVDEIDAVWLTRTLHVAGIGRHSRVQSFTLTAIGTGQVAENYRFGLRWTNEDDVALPGSVVGKFPSRNPRSRAAGQAGAYIREFGFYRDLQRLVPVPTPLIHHAEFDTATADFVLLMNDVQPSRTGDQLVGCDVANAEIAIDAIAGLHTATWGRLDLLASFDWLPMPSAELLAFRVSMYRQFYEGFVGWYADRLTEKDLAIGRWIGEKFASLTESQTLPRCAVHNDFRLDNLLFATGPGAPPVTVVDWQTLGVGFGPVDIAYFIGAGLQPEPSPRQERTLVDRYCARLNEGGLDVGSDEVWASYRLGSASGYVMAVAASQQVIRTDRGDDMFMAMATRHANQMRRVGLV